MSYIEGPPLLPARERSRILPDAVRLRQERLALRVSPGADKMPRSVDGLTITSVKTVP
jgi:hypothetical protein